MAATAVGELIAAYREADKNFAAAQSGPEHLRSGEFARIIGNLQGSIVLALIEMGEYERFRSENGRDREALGTTARLE